MCGRAGRKGKDDAGETYLICVKADMQAVCDLLDADMPAIESCLAPEKRGLKRYVFLIQLFCHCPRIIRSHPKALYLKPLRQDWYPVVRRSKNMFGARFFTAHWTRRSHIPL